MLGDAMVNNLHLKSRKHFPRSSQCGHLKTRYWKYTPMKPQSIQNRYAYSLIDLLNTKNKNLLTRLDVSEKTWISVRIVCRPKGERFRS